MKILSLALVLMASMAFVLMGCSDNPGVGPTSTNQSHAISLMKTTGPRAWIFRYDVNGGFWFADWNTGLLVTFSVDDLSAYCAHQGGFDELSLKDLCLPNVNPDLRRLVGMGVGRDVTVYAWQGIVFNPEATGLRDYICGITPMAVGIGNIKNTDNDVYSWMLNTNNSNAYGCMGNGALQGVDGQKYNLNLVYRIVWDPNGTNFHETFKLELIPRGK
jgi:hypothetical protein